MSYELWISCLIFSFFTAISPGTGTILSIKDSLNYGWRKTSITILGQELSLMLIILIVITSINNFFLKYKYTLLIIKIIGFIWLIILSYNQWNFNFDKKYFKFNKKKNNSIKRFISGFFINLTNPKAIILITTIVPQFINYSNFFYKQVYIITSTIIIIDTIITHIYAMTVYKLKNILKNKKVINYQNKFLSILLIIIALSILI